MDGARMPRRSASLRIESASGPSSSRRERAAATTSCARGLSGSGLPRLTMVAILATTVSLVKETTMQTRPITANLVLLTRFRFVNAYLVAEADGLTLVDTTMGRAADAILAAAAARAQPIRRIALTYGHGVHVGALDALKERLGDSGEVLMPEPDARIHAGEQVVQGT